VPGGSLRDETTISLSDDTHLTVYIEKYSMMTSYNNLPAWCMCSLR
jgi:hypothetical protein